MLSLCLWAFVFSFTLESPPYWGFTVEPLGFRAFWEAPASGCFLTSPALSAFSGQLRVERWHHPMAVVGGSRNVDNCSAWLPSLALKDGSSHMLRFKQDSLIFWGQSHFPHFRVSWLPIYQLDDVIHAALLKSAAQERPTLDFVLCFFSHCHSLNLPSEVSVVIFLLHLAWYLGTYLPKDSLYRQTLCTSFSIL